VDGPPLADAAPDGAAAADARADGGSDGAVSIYQGTYDIGCACRLERPPTGTGGSPLAALAAITLLALIARRRGR
jgi:MYXO-CTERM domain-containing protein